MPLQLLLILPFIRLGQWIFAWGPHQAMTAGILLHSSPTQLATQMVGMAGQAVLAWMLVAGPAVALLTATLTPVLKRIPALCPSQAGN